MDRVWKNFQVRDGKILYCLKQIIGRNMGSRNVYGEVSEGNEYMYWKLEEM